MELRSIVGGTTAFLMEVAHKSEVKLTGNTLRVYLYAIEKSRVGVREVQRALSLSNASPAQHHLMKLVELGALTQTDGDHDVSNVVKVDVVNDFLRLRGLLIPRFVFYSVAFSILTAYFGGLVFASSSWSPSQLWPIGLLAVASCILWYESIKAWKCVTAF